MPYSNIALMPGTQPQYNPAWHVDYGNSDPQASLYGNPTPNAPTNIDYSKGVFGSAYNSPYLGVGYDSSQIASAANPGQASAPNQVMPLSYSGTQMQSPYNISPDPSGYNPVFGGVPGQIGLPSPSQDLGNVLPGLGGVNQSLLADLIAQSQGQLSPGTQNLLQDQSAQFGVGSGMPGSGLARSRNLRDLGLTSEALQNQAFQNYANLIGTASRTQTLDPNLQATIASRNAALKAAPIPAQAQSYAQSLFNSYLQGMRGPGGGTGGYTGGPAGGTAAAPTTPFVGGTPSPSPYTPGYNPSQPYGPTDMAPIGADPWADFITGFGTEPGVATTSSNLNYDPTMDYSGGGGGAYDPYADFNFYGGF